MKSSKINLFVVTGVSLLLFLFTCIAVYGDTTGWAYTSPIPFGKAGFPAIYKNGYLYTFGGLNSSSNGITDIDRALVNSNGTLGTWEKVGDLDIPLSRNAAVLVGDYAYIVGGAEGNSYPEVAQVRKIKINLDGSLGTLSIESTQLNTARVDHSVVYSNGYIYAIGGGSSGSFLSSVEYASVNPDGTLGVWNYTQSLNTQRWINQSVTVNGYIYCLGGQSNSGYPRQAEFAKVTTNGQLTPWQNTGGNMPACWEDPGLVNIGNSIYAYGGWDDSQGHEGTETIQAGINSDGTLQTWVDTNTHLNQERSDMGFVNINNRFYAIGGVSQHSGVLVFLSSVEYLDLNTTTPPPTGSGNALSFDGINDSVIIQSSSTLSFTTIFTVEAWINPENLSNSGHFVSADDESGGRREWHLEFSNNGVGIPRLVVFYQSANPYYKTAESETPISSGVWSHIAGVYDGASIYLYVNGHLEAATADTSLVPNTGVPLTIGNWYNMTRPFTGIIDEVRVWNIARSQSQIQSAMNCPLVGNESGLVGYWRLDEGSGQIAYDASGNGNNGQLGTAPGVDSNDPTWVVSGAPLICNSTTTTQNPPPTGAGNALSFNGPADAGPGTVVEIPDSPSFTLETTFTVEAWIKPTQYGYGHVVSKDDEMGRRDWDIDFSDSGTFETSIYYHQDPYYYYARSVSAIPLNIWTHVAGVYDGSSIYTYINGQLAAVTADTSPIPNTGVPITIGNWFTGTRPFNGTIDEVRVWNIARSQSQIQGSMNCSLTGNEAGLVGYWRLDEGAGQVVYDASGHGNNGQLGSTSTTDSNDPTWVVSNAPLTCNLTVVNSNDWPTFKHDNERSGYSPDTVLLPPLELKWSFTPGGSDYNYFSPPVISSGVVYFGAGNGKVYARDAVTGVEKWTFQNSARSCTPTVDNGILYVGSSNNNLYALHTSNGTELWHFTTGGVIHSGTAVAYGNVYFASWDGYIYAVSTSNGSLVWKYNTGEAIEPQPTVVNGVVYLGHWAINAYTGQLVWNNSLGTSLQACAVYGGVIYAGALNGNIYALNTSNSSVKWSYSAGASVVNVPSFWNGRIYVGSDGGTMYCLDTVDGSLKWKFTPSPYSWWFNNAVIANGIVYIGSLNTIYALNAMTGDTVWQYASSWGNLAAIANGLLYVGSANTDAVFRVFGIASTIVNQPPSPPTDLVAIARNAQVQLTWNANGEPDLAGYNVYRRTSSTSYAKINSGLVSGTAYLDYDVTNETTYYYVVRAVDNASLEGGDSNEVNATPHLLFIDFLVSTDTERVVFETPFGIPLPTGQPNITWLPSYDGVSGVLKIEFTDLYQAVKITLEKPEWFSTESGKWYLLKVRTESDVSIPNMITVGGMLYTGLPPGETEISSDNLISLKTGWDLLRNVQESYGGVSPRYPQIMIRNNNTLPATVYIDYIQVKEIPDLIE